MKMTMFEIGFPWDSEAMESSFTWGWSSCGAIVSALLEVPFLSFLLIVVRESDGCVFFDISWIKVLELLKGLVQEHVSVIYITNSRAPHFNDYTFMLYKIISQRDGPIELSEHTIPTLALLILMIIHFILYKIISPKDGLYKLSEHINPLNIYELV